jgi:hypothetical protein
MDVSNVELGGFAQHAQVEGWLGAGDIGLRSRFHSLDP